MNRPRRGSVANACTDESTPERTMKVPSSDSVNAQQREQHRPRLEGAALLGHRERMDQRRAREPGHEGRVLHRIPEPPAAPSELVVRPGAAQHDAQRQEDPRGNGPRTRPARPRGVEFAQAISAVPTANAKAHRRSRRSPCTAIGGCATMPGSCSSGFRSLPVHRGHRQQAVERVRRRQHEQQEAGSAIQASITRASTRATIAARQLAAPLRDRQPSRPP